MKNINIEYRDNTPVLSLFLHKSTGLLAILDEQTQFPKVTVVMYAMAAAMATAAPIARVRLFMYYFFVCSPCAPDHFSKLQKKCS